MTFLRPEVLDFFRRWREVIATGLVMLWGVHLIGRAVERGSLGLGLVGTTVAVVFAALLFLAIVRARLAVPGQAVGVVQVDEKQVAYLAPMGGAFVSLDDLTRLEVIAHADERHWVLTHLSGPALVIPANATGAEALIDAFATLPGLRIEDAARAVARTRGRTLVWTRALT